MKDYARRIRTVYPDLVVTTIVPVEGHGQNNDVLIVNESAIFRFPKYTTGVANAARLVQTLRAIAPRVNLLVPNPLWTSLDDPRPGQAFVGYPIIPGEPLWMERFARLSEVDRQYLADQLAEFLRCLHAIPAAAVRPDEVIGFNPLAPWDRLYQRIRQKLFEHMRPEARAAVARRFDDFLGNPSHHAIRPSLIHGDFGGSNILFDPATMRVSGVIDWDSAGLGDPAIDLAAASGYGLEHLAHRYPEVEAYRDRIDFYRSTFALQEALFGVENGDAKAFERGIESYQ